MSELKTDYNMLVNAEGHLHFRGPPSSIRPCYAGFDRLHALKSCMSEAAALLTELATPLTISSIPVGMSFVRLLYAIVTFDVSF